MSVKFFYIIYVYKIYSKSDAKVTNKSRHDEIFHYKT